MCSLVLLLFLTFYWLDQICVSFPPVDIFLIYGIYALFFYVLKKKKERKIKENHFASSYLKHPQLINSSSYISQSVKTMQWLNFCPRSILFICRPAPESLKLTLLVLMLSADRSEGLVHFLYLTTASGVAFLSLISATQGSISFVSLHEARKCFLSIRKYYYLITFLYN